MIILILFCIIINGLFFESGTRADEEKKLFAFNTCTLAETATISQCQYVVTATKSKLTATGIFAGQVRSMDACRQKCQSQFGQKNGSAFTVAPDSVIQSSGLPSDCNLYASYASKDIKASAFSNVYTLICKAVGYGYQFMKDSRNIALKAASIY